MPAARDVVENVASKSPPAAGSSGAVPSVVLPDVKVTVPVGMPTPAKPTAAVNVTVFPESAL